MLLKFKKNSAKRKVFWRELKKNETAKDAKHITNKCILVVAKAKKEWKRN